MNLENASRFTGPLLMAPTRHGMIYREKFSSEEAKHFAAKRLPRVSGQIAVIPVHGTLAYFDDPWFGITSMVRLGRMVDAAMAMKEIKAVIYDYDTPGGTVAGTPEFAAKMLGYRGVKPQIAIANPEAASAGIWLATTADQLAVTPSGEVGSIGVWTSHVDNSKYLEMTGREVTLISAGKYKVEGHPYGPLTDESRAEMQRSVDESYRDFLAAVAKHRNVSMETVRKDFGEGRMLSARKAVEVGLADRSEAFDGVLGRMRGENRGGSQANSELSEELSRVYHDGCDSDKLTSILSEQYSRDDDDELQIALAERG